MTGITRACSRLMGEILHALGGRDGVRSTSSCNPQSSPPPPPVDDLLLQALTSVFGMDQTNCRISKQKARQVVEKLGLVEDEFDLPGGCVLEDDVAVEEMLGLGEDGSNRNELLRQAFRIFDEDGNGFIDALELKRVLQCLGLDNGWEMAQIEKMLKVVDLNLDGKVDFTEFELMMIHGLN